MAEDVIGLPQTKEELQVLLDSFQRWAEKNGLEWNPIKSQVLMINKPTGVDAVDVMLGVTRLDVRDVIEYLRQQLTRDGFRGKDKAELYSKCNAALQTLLATACCTARLHSSWRSSSGVLKNTCAFSLELTMRFYPIPSAERPEALGMHFAALVFFYLYLLPLSTIRRRCRWWLVGLRRRGLIILRHR